jgi:hypothetical protein
VSQRRLEALRNLAARPGTPEEGAVARAMLAKLESRPAVELHGLDILKQYLRDGDYDAFRNNMRREYPLQEKPSARLWTCPCGLKWPTNEPCRNTFGAHGRIGNERFERFGRAVRVYYNYWAYEPNCPGTLVGYSKEWNWVRIKFDHLKTVRSVPIYSPKGWHLSTEPLPVARTIWLST